MKQYYYSIHTGWPGRTESPAAVGARFLATLDAFDRIDRAFGDWHVTDFVERADMPLDVETRRKIADLVANNVAVDDFDEPDPNSGYSMCATTGEELGPKSFSFWASAGSKYNNDARLEAGTYKVPADPSIRSFAIFRAALLAIVANWGCSWAKADVFQEADPIDVSLPPGVPYLLPPGPPGMIWMLYLSAPLATGLQPPPDMPAEQTPDGGLLLLAAEDRFDPANPLHLARSGELVAILKSRGES